MGKTIPNGYEVLENGVVISPRGKSIRPNLVGAGYQQVRCGASFREYTHRLVAAKYVPNPDNLPCVNHIDGDKTNNHFSNLEWVTYAGNMKHAALLGLCGGIYGRQKLVPSEALDNAIIEAYKHYGSAKAMAKASYFNCTPETITGYIRKRNLGIEYKVNQHG